MPAHRPTFDSIPSAPITILARTSYVFPRYCLAPLTKPSSIMRSIARVFSYYAPARQMFASVCQTLFPKEAYFSKRFSAITILVPSGE